MVKRFVLSIFAAALVTGMLCGCTSVRNNYLQPQDLAGCLERAGMQVESVRPLPPDPFRATAGCAIKIKGVVAEVGVYKYDLDSKVQKERLEQIRKNKCTYVIGVKFPVVVHGSFMIMGLDKNTRKRDILKALKYFQ